MGSSFGISDVSSYLGDLIGSVSGLASYSTAVLVACAILTLILTIVCYVLLVPHEKRVEEGRSRSQAFFNFDRLIISPILKFVYLLVSIGLIVFGIASIVQLIVTAVEYATSYPLWLALLALVQVAIGEVVVRLVFELVFLLVKLVEQADAIRRALKGGGRTDAGVAQVPFGPAPFPQGPSSAGPSAPSGFRPDATGPAPAMGMSARPTAQPGPQPPARPGAQWYPSSADSTTIMPQNINVDVQAIVPDESAPADVTTRMGQPVRTVVNPGAAPEAGPVGGMPASHGWDCACGMRGNADADLFCPRCGRPRPTE
ncbi:MAG: DUF4282 domain-containing protein [Coriobacteriales bacterium]|jgi:hypothetical protein